MPRPSDAWLRALHQPPPSKCVRKSQRWCASCGTWVHKTTKRHQCDLPVEQRGKRRRWCTFCQTYVRIWSVTNPTRRLRHRCDAPPLEVPDHVRWKRCRTCRESWPRTRDYFAYWPKAKYWCPHCRACDREARRRRELARAGRNRVTT